VSVWYLVMVLCAVANFSVREFRYVVRSFHPPYHDAFAEYVHRGVLFCVF